ncbi:hypothetical protein MTsPCn9_27270 [Croceitalea sp. MTPC9]|uniref:DUF4136 domain-containing protein n=1 Tax=unclassified Croceitalea TaxID=2632280 RepID=UPI002B39880A|nr:hypothetical protein MTsPCn6_22910 [Croceitalea sp. MTPC6]GMN17789.1 hypothetical protein MTsPCn9_27270 [Croceitalea sp. MTPC9]
MRNLLYILILCCLVACNAVRVDYDYDKVTDFSNYTTYNYFQDMQSGLSQLDEKRLLNVLDSTLQAKGYLLSEEPEFLVNIKSGVFQSNSGSNVGVGVGGGGRNVGGGLSIGIPVGNSGLQREIIFDFVDVGRNALFWQANAQSGFRDNAAPIEREQQLRRVVAKVFSKYPPDLK